MGLFDQLINVAANMTPYGGLANAGRQQNFGRDRTITPAQPPNPHPTQYVGDRPYEQIVTGRQPTDASQLSGSWSGLRQPILAARADQFVRQMQQNQSAPGMRFNPQARLDPSQVQDRRGPSTDASQMSSPGGWAMLRQLLGGQ